MHPAFRAEGYRGKGFWGIWAARKSCVLMRACSNGRTVLS